jgi:hypothetical protein
MGHDAASPAMRRSPARRSSGIARSRVRGPARERGAAGMRIGGDGGGRDADRQRGWLKSDRTGRPGALLASISLSIEQLCGNKLKIKKRYMQSRFNYFSIINFLFNINSIFC